MNHINDGGPAFPTTWVNDSDVNLTAPNGQVCPPYSSVPLPGLSLRDYFAAKAMCAALMTVEPTKNDTHARIAAAASRVAYIVADAMLRAREN